MKIKILLLSVLFLIGFNPTYSQSNFNVDFDYAVFPIDQSEGYVEIYYSFYQPLMSITDSENGKIVTGLLGVKIERGVEAEVVLQKDYNFKTLYTEEKDKQTLTGTLKYFLPAGEYRCSLIGKDFSDDNKSDSAKFLFTIKGMPTDRFSISDIELCSKIIQGNANEKSFFYKNTLEVIPNPSLVYGENLPALFYYTEIYNLNLAVKAPKLKIDHYIFDSMNETVYSRTKYFNRSNSSSVDFGAVNVRKYPSGVYSLVITVTDTVSKKSHRSLKKFYVVNSDIEIKSPVLTEENDLLASELSVLNKDEIDEMFEMSKYIATRQEKAAWKKLSNMQGKKEFLHKFWSSRDYDKSTAVNEMKNEYFSRVQFAAKNFSDVFKKRGWDSDRGRVYIVYGAPDEVERYPNEIDKKPYEIWDYNQIEGGVIFVFVDYNGFNEYRLVHSTKFGELADKDWLQRISN